MIEQVILIVLFVALGVVVAACIVLWRRRN
jgi:hypothetical protein